MCVFVCVFVRREDKETRKDECDEQVSLSFVIPSELPTTGDMRGGSGERVESVREHLAASPLFSFFFFGFVFRSCSTNPKTGVHKQWIFFIHIGK